MKGVVSFPPANITLTESLGETAAKETRQEPTTVEPKEPEEQQDAIPVVTTEIEKPPSTLDIIKEEPEEPPR